MSGSQGWLAQPDSATKIASAPVTFISFTIAMQLRARMPIAVIAQIGAAARIVRFESLHAVSDSIVGRTFVVGGRPITIIIRTRVVVGGRQHSPGVISPPAPPTATPISAAPTSAVPAATVVTNETEIVLRH